MTDKSKGDIRQRVDRERLQDGDSDVRRLMALAARRREPPQGMRERVHSAVLAGWEFRPEHKPRARFHPALRPWALAASLVFALGIVIGYSYWYPLSNSVPAGVLLHARGEHSVMTETGEAYIPEPEAELRGGMLVQTAADGVMMIRLDPHTTLRLGSNTRATLQQGAEVWLHRGQLYIDSSGTRGGQGEPAVRIVTPFASVTDVGTLFSVAVAGESLTVAVREGEVRVQLDAGASPDLASPGGSLAAVAGAGIGDLVTIGEDGSVRRERIATTDRRWSWIHMATEEFALNSSTLYDFLLWAARESGLELKFTSDAVQLAARQTRLHGSVQGLAPVDAITTVLATTDFITREGAPYELVVDFRR